MRTELVYFLGWTAFGVGWVLRGLAQLRTEGVGWVALGFLVAGVGMVAFSAVGYSNPQGSGVPSEPGLRLYGIVFCGLALLVVGAVELAVTV